MKTGNAGLVVVGILVALAVAGLVVKDRITTSRTAATIAAAKHHLRYCAICRECGLSAEQIATTRRPIPCQVRDTQTGNPNLHSKEAP